MRSAIARTTNAAPTPARNASQTLARDTGMRLSEARAANVPGNSARSASISAPYALRKGQPTGRRTYETPSTDERADEVTLDRPGEPRPHFVLVRHDRGTHTEHHELVERGLFGGLPRLAPHLIPSRQDARMTLATLGVLHGDATRDDRAAPFERVAELAERRRLEAELALQILYGARPRRPQMPHDASGIVLAALGRLERRPAERIGRACALRRQEERLPPVQLRLEDTFALRDLATPAPLRLRPRREAPLRLLERLLVRRREEAGQDAVLRERQDLPFRKEREGIVERPQLPVGSEPAVEEPPCAKLGQRDRFLAYARVSAFSTSSRAVRPSSGYEATPHERTGIGIERPAPLGSATCVWVGDSMRRMTTFSASSRGVSGMTMANSSPPYRAGTSSVRTWELMRWPRMRRTSLPARWPYVSFTFFSLSRSKNATASGVWWRS